MWTKENLYVNMVLCFPGWFDFRIISLYSHLRLWNVDGVFGNHCMNENG